MDLPSFLSIGLKTQLKLELVLKSLTFDPSDEKYCYTPRFAIRSVSTSQEKTVPNKRFYVSTISSSKVGDKIRSL